jgi:chorismate synthase
LPIGLGGYSQADNRLDARLAEKIMSIPGVKAVECGFAAALSRQAGSFVDSLKYDHGRGFYHSSNNAAGIEGGMTNGEPLIMRFHMKPLPGGGDAESINLDTMKSQRPEPYRSDTQALQAAAVVAESIVALELAAQILQFTGGADLETVHERFVGLSRF